RSWGDTLRYGFTATEVNYRWVQEDCVDNYHEPGGEVACSAPRKEITDKVSLGGPGDLGQVEYQPMIPRLQLRLPGTARMEVPVTCEGPNHPKNTNSFITQGDLIDISAASGCDLISTVCTPPTICQFTKDPAVQRGCV